MDKRTQAQNRRLFWLLGQVGLTDKAAIAELVMEWTNGRTSHTSELTYNECQNIIRNLDDALNRSKDPKDSGKLDQRRKAVIKAIFTYFELRGKTVSMEYVKAVACRAAGNAVSFNAISEGQLLRIYAEFCRKQTAASVRNEIDEELRITNSN